MAIRDIRQTHTIAVLDVSQAAYDEIAKKLRAASYDHVFGADGTIDMTGIGINANPPLETPAREPEPIYSHPECPFKYCSEPRGGICREGGTCQHIQPPQG